MGQNLRKFPSFLLLVLFLFNIANQIFFIHTHTVDRRAVVHAHPSTNKDHTHTNWEYIIIANLNCQNLVTVDSFHIEEVTYPFLYSIENLSFFPIYIGLHYYNPFHRGPPLV